MKTHSSSQFPRLHFTPRSVRMSCPGMTLLEMSIVLLVMLSLIGIMFIGAQAWKNGSDRTLCIMNLQNVQKGVRSYSNLYGVEPGMTVDGLQSKVIGMGRFVESAPRCPHGGTYNYGGDLVPLVGDLYMSCSLEATGGHKPEEMSDW